MVCLEGTLLCPAAFLVWFFFQAFPLPFPLLKFFSFNYLITFLVSFIWNSQKCPVSQNIWCLIKNPIKKTSLKQFFKGVVHEQPWYTIVWFVWRVHYCVQLLSWCDFFQAFPLPFPLLKLFSFIVFLWYYYWISMEFLWGFHDVSMIFLEDFYGISEGVLWEFYGILMGFPLDSYGISIGFLWNFYWIPVGFPRYFHNVSMIFLWDYYWNSHGISFVVPMLFHVISMIFLWDFCEIPMGFPWYFYYISLGLLLDFYGMSIESKLAVNWNQLKVNSK